MMQFRRDGPRGASRSAVAARWAAIVGGVLALVLACGFILFANLATRGPSAIVPAADGIVVLTGGEARLHEAGRLLRDGHARRLLISGVNRKTGREDLMRLTGLDVRRFDCCVDIGYEALDTIGNAEEARAFSERWRFSRLIVVTASYHMPRSLVELARALPAATLIPHPVQPAGFKSGPWWLHPAVAKVLVAEYLKLLPSAARLVLARLAGGERPSVSVVTGRGDHRT